jgi:Ribonuclease HepT-like
LALRGEQGASSDLDLLVDMTEGRSLFDLIALSNDCLYRVGRIAFFKSPMIQDAVVRNLEVVGEATKQVPDSLRERVPELSWREMAGMRDKLIHDYLGVISISSGTRASSPNHAVSPR